MQMTPATLEVFLQSRASAALAADVDLRPFILTAFNHAKRAGRFVGPNPAAEVARRKVAKRLPDFLHAEEVPHVLNALTDRWRSLFATAIFTGIPQRSHGDACINSEDRPPTKRSSRWPSGSCALPMSRALRSQQAPLSSSRRRGPRAPASPSYVLALLTDETARRIVA
jgi:hypothetical protein